MESGNMQFPKIDQKQEPKGKRSYRCNRWGYFIGYIGRKRWMTFVKEQDAIHWVAKDKSSNLK